MFNLVYNKYKLSAFETNIWESIKELKLYEKILLVIVILGVILSLIFSLFEISYGSLISVGICVVSLVILFIIRSSPKEKRRIVNESIEPYVNGRVKKLVDLLREFEIDIDNEKHLDMLIEMAKREQERYDVWKGFRTVVKGMSTYVFIPIITIFLAEFFKDTDPLNIIKKAIVVLLICAVILLVLVAFAISIDDIFNSDKNRLGYFIKDLEEVKVFEKGIKKICKDDIKTVS